MNTPEYNDIPDDGYDHYYELWAKELDESFIEDLDNYYMYYLAELENECNS